MHISSSYAKILGEKLFRTWEIPRSGSKAEDGEKKREKERGAKVGDNNGQATHGARKHAWRTQAAWANKRSKGNLKRLDTKISFYLVLNDFVKIPLPVVHLICVSPNLVMLWDPGTVDTGPLHMCVAGKVKGS